MEQKINKIYIGIIILLLILSIYLFISKEKFIKNDNDSCNKMNDTVGNMKDIKNCPEIYEELAECRMSVSENVDNQNQSNEELVNFIGNFIKDLS
jgi:hypothetical protein